MDVPGTRFTAHNLGPYFERNEEFHDYFQLEAPPNTVIWRKPVYQDHASAPMILTSATRSFIVAEVTVSVDLDVEWDQAGLVLFTHFDTSPPTAPLRRRRTSSLLGEHSHQQNRKWIKAGLGLSSGEPGLCTVLANPNCGPDSSFTPTYTSYYDGQLPSIRVKLERVNDDLWVWYKIPESASVADMEYRSPAEVSLDWKKTREVSGFFAGLGKEADITVGCYVSRPMPLEEEDKNTLFAEFEDLEIL
ncbi:hypothetical protein DV735_g2879, partial [Chaetothyriales sp. CBS 134920]